MRPKHSLQDYVTASTWDRYRAPIKALFESSSLAEDGEYWIAALLLLQKDNAWVDSSVSEFANSSPEVLEGIGLAQIEETQIGIWNELLKQNSLEAHVVSLVVDAAGEHLNNKEREASGNAGGESETYEVPTKGDGSEEAPSTTVAIDSESEIGVSVDGLNTDGEVSERFAELEELLLEPFAEDLSLTLGQIQHLGEDTYVVEECLPQGYYRARRERDGVPVLIRMGAIPSRDLWMKVGLVSGHPRLPNVIYEGKDGLVLDINEENPVPVEIPLYQAVQYLIGVAQLLRFLAVKGAAVTDIDPSSLILVPDLGVRLQYLPTLVPLGQPAQVTLGDGVTPMEGSDTVSATETTSVAVWGTLLYWLALGQSLPVEGVGMVAMSAIREPGLPQLLCATLLDTEPGIDLRALLGLCQNFRHPPLPLYQTGVGTTVGLNPDRPCNEDSYGFVNNVWEFHNEHWQCIRACVADGMGGAAAGELASQAAVETFCHIPTSENLEEPDVQARWTRELGWAANDAVVDAVGEQGGGCTLTGVVLVRDCLTLAHVGDSRAYLFSPDTGLEILSRDHSMVKAMVDSGNMTEDEAAASPDTNQVLRSLGSARKANLHEEYVDSLSGASNSDKLSSRSDWLYLKPGELVLIMSDGIWGSWEYRESVISGELTKIINEKNLCPQGIADALIECALEAGADDNATVVVLSRIK